MRDIDRIEPFLDRLGQLWKGLPDFRFGQLIYLLMDELNIDIFFPEEEEWLKAMETVKQRFKIGDNKDT